LAGTAAKRGSVPAGCLAWMAKYGLEYFVQKTYYDREQRRTFNEGGGEDHGTTDVTGSLWLTCDGFGGFATDKTNSEAGTKCRDTCSKSSHNKEFKGLKKIV